MQMAGGIGHSEWSESQATSLIVHGYSCPCLTLKVTLLSSSPSIWVYNARCAERWSFAQFCFVLFLSLLFVFVFVCFSFLFVCLLACLLVCLFAQSRAQWQLCTVARCGNAIYEMAKPRYIHHCFNRSSRRTDPVNCPRSSSSQCRARNSKYTSVENLWPSGRQCHHFTRQTHEDWQPESVYRRLWWLFGSNAEK